MRKAVNLVVAFLLCAALTSIPASEADAFPCTETYPRAGTSAEASVTVATGVTATIRTPSPGDVTNYDLNKYVIADIYMFNTNGNGAFVQLGWYLGNASQLPPTNQPRLFWGENSPDPTFGENLHAGPLLTWGAVYSYMITNPLDGSNKFNIWLQGSLIAQTDYGHQLNTVGFTGETRYKCSRMEGKASHAVAPLRTLQYRYGSWYYFTGTRTVNQADFYSVSGGDIATNYVYGGG